MPNTELLNLKELFSQLDKRLEFLRDNRTEINVSMPHLNYYKPIAIPPISDNINSFVEIGLKKIKRALEDVERLLNKKESIVDNIFFSEGSNPFSEPYKNNPDKKRSAQLEEYPAFKRELEYYKTQLSKVEMELIENLNTPNKKDESNPNKIEKCSVFTLSNTFELPKLKIANQESTETSLSREQLAILFTYLMDAKHKILLKFDDKSISKILEVLTFHSDESMRQRGFVNVQGRKSTVPPDNNPSGLNNLEIVRDALSKVLESINTDLQESSPKK